MFKYASNGSLFFMLVLYSISKLNLFLTTDILPIIEKNSGKNIKKGSKKDITIQNPCLKWNALEKVFSDPEFLRKKSVKEVLNIFVSDVF